MVSNILIWLLLRQIFGGWCKDIYLIWLTNILYFRKVAYSTANASSSKCCSNFEKFLISSVIKQSISEIKCNPLWHCQTEQNLKQGIIMLVSHSLNFDAVFFRKFFNFQQSKLASIKISHTNFLTIIMENMEIIRNNEEQVNGLQMSVNWKQTKKILWFLLCWIYQINRIQFYSINGW